MRLSCEHLEGTKTARVAVTVGPGSAIYPLVGLRQTLCISAFSSTKWGESNFPVRRALKICMSSRARAGQRVAQCGEAAQLLGFQT